MYIHSFSIFLVHCFYVHKSKADASPILAKLSGCAEEDAARLIRFGRRLSELFAPIELTKHLARQELGWWQIWEIS